MPLCVCVCVCVCERERERETERERERERERFVVQLLICVPLFSTPWTIAHQAPLSIGFSRQEYWSGWPFPSPGDLPDPGIKPESPTSAARFFTTEPSGKSYVCV